MRIHGNVRLGGRSVSRMLTGLLVAMTCFGAYGDTPPHSAVQMSSPQNFEAISPAEFHVPANRQVVRADAELRNTSRCCLRMATLCCGHWKCGLVPSWVVEFPDDKDGPIIRDSVKLDLSHLSGNIVRPGKRSCPFAIEFRLKSGSSEGDHETFRLFFTLTNPRTGAIQTADWAVDVVIRKGGIPLLVSEKIPFPSEGR